MNQSDPQARRRSGPRGDTPRADRLLDTCLDSSRLFSLRPDEVLDETARLLTEAVPEAHVRVLPLERRDVLGGGQLTAGESALFRRVVEDERSVRDEDVLAVPLHVRRDGERRLVGVAFLSGDNLSLPDAIQPLVDFIAERAAVALDHALLYETQAEISHELQSMLLPLEPPSVEGLEIGLLFRSRTAGAEAGGDFVDFVSMSRRHLAVAVGDVSGKGIRAMATTVMVKYALRAITATLSWPTWPGEALRDLHNALQGQLDPSSFVTAVFGTIDVSRHTISLAGAGHPAPFLVRADGGVERPFLLTGPAIALVDYSELEAYPTERISLQPGDTVVFHTDGIGELRNGGGQFYEDARMADALRELHGLPPRQMVDGLLADALSYSASRAADDIALVAVRLVGIPD